MQSIRFLGTSFLTMLIFGCNSGDKELSSENAVALNIEKTISEIKPERRNLPSSFGKYWYAGTAEITSYKLIQSRYGELREGAAVTIFVTEDFDSNNQVKSDRRTESDTPMLKLNLTKKFNTGIYPYSIMTSTFNAVNDTRHSLKITNSVQEWCGQTYMQLNNQNQFEIQANSYFQSEGDQRIILEKTWLEDELWNRIRLNPKELPTGTFKMIPAFETIRLGHKEIKKYLVEGTLLIEEKTSNYTISYPELNRKLAITFSNNFPHSIEKWEETHANGQVTTATKIKRMQSSYWSQNSNKFSVLRDSLGL